METHQPRTLTDLTASPYERMELIDGEIIARPRAAAIHSIVQSHTCIEIAPYNRISGPGGWHILTEISVSYERHQCPSHDIAGWRKQRLPVLPDGIIDMTPDWVCEIVSPGHERKDTLTLFLLLQRHKVPFYWLIWPEDKVLIAHQLDGDSYRVVKTISGQTKARIPPFDDIELDLNYILGE